MRAILVSVNYSDLLAITLPYNRHHFSDVMVVTSYDDLPNVLHIAQANNCKLHVTNAFYDNSARFNKFKALEEALDIYGREGWMCLMDADILWPKGLRIEHPGDCLVMTNPVVSMQPTAGIMLTPGMLCSPLRRMCTEVGKLWCHGINLNVSVWELEREFPEGTQFKTLQYPPESEWGKFPIHRNVNEWAGYSQIFHASDPALGQTPWHEIDWQHAGGADSFFQMRWPTEKKVRPPFEVLHLGDAGKNWMGRATPYLDGTVPSDSAENLARMDSIWRERRGKVGPARFTDEKVK